MGFGQRSCRNLRGPAAACKAADTGSIPVGAFSRRAKSGLSHGSVSRICPGNSSADTIGATNTPSPADGMPETSSPGAGGRGVDVRRPPEETLTEALGIRVALRRVDSVRARDVDSVRARDRRQSGTPRHHWPGRPIKRRAMALAGRSVLRTPALCPSVEQLRQHLHPAQARNPVAEFRRPARFRRKPRERRRSSRLPGVEPVPRQALLQRDRQERPDRMPGRSGNGTYPKPPCRNGPLSP